MKVDLNQKAAFFKIIPDLLDQGEDLRMGKYLRGAEKALLGRRLHILLSCNIDTQKCSFPIKVHN